MKSGDYVIIKHKSFEEELVCYITGRGSYNNMIYVVVDQISDQISESEMILYVKNIESVKYIDEIQYRLS